MVDPVFQRQDIFVVCDVAQISWWRIVGHSIDEHLAGAKIVGRCIKADDKMPREEILLPDLVLGIRVDEYVREWRCRVSHIDRKSVVSGKSVSVRVDLGGRSIIKKKKKTT